jgi:hypothetical protein
MVNSLFDFQFQKYFVADFTQSIEGSTKSFESVKELISALNEMRNFKFTYGSLVIYCHSYFYSPFILNQNFKSLYLINIM